MSADDSSAATAAPVSVADGPGVVVDAVAGAGTAVPASPLTGDALAGATSLGGDTAECPDPPQPTTRQATQSREIARAFMARTVSPLLGDGKAANHFDAGRRLWRDPQRDGTLDGFEKQGAHQIFSPSTERIERR